MDCPKDRTPLEFVPFHSIPIHRCPKCEGTWYATDQLRILKDKEAHGDYCWINLDLWRDTAKFRAASSSRYTCPADSTPLIPVHYENTLIVADIYVRRAKAYGSTRASMHGSSSFLPMPWMPNPLETISAICATSSEK